MRKEAVKFPVRDFIILLNLGFSNRLKFSVDVQLLRMEMESAFRLTCSLVTVSHPFQASVWTGKRWPLPAAGHMWGGP